jgi:Na+-translocating ferredoxin:NAD+ oxidoreductase RnfG subunit
VLQFDHDPRPVIADPAAAYYGVQVTDRTLVPGEGARIGTTKLDWWLNHVPAPAKVKPAVAVAESAH